MTIALACMGGEDAERAVRRELSCTSVVTRERAGLRLDHLAPPSLEFLHGRRMMPNVLLASPDALLGRSVLWSLAKVRIAAEWVRSVAELHRWIARTRDGLPGLVLLDWELPGAPPGEALGVLEGFLPASTIVVLAEGLTGDTAAVLLSRGVPSIQKPIHPFVLSMLALDLSADAGGATVTAVVSEPTGAGAPARPSPSFENLVAAYASSRRLSKQQALILDLYLNGKSDKEIAEHCACSGATVYEHWRRMAKKSGGRQKSDLIADFHRYLRQTPLPGSLRRPLQAS
jgi:DNA-binding NarL/FixJ family response regulator